jgi:hypothetical protein
MELDKLFKLFSDFEFGRRSDWGGRETNWSSPRSVSSTQVETRETRPSRAASSSDDRLEVSATASLPVSALIDLALSRETKAPRTDCLCLRPVRGTASSQMGGTPAVVVDAPVGARTRRDSGVTTRVS